MQRLKDAWTDLHKALCVLQDLPKFRSTTILLAKTYTAIGLLLMLLGRVSESMSHAEEAVRLMTDLGDDEEAFNPEYQRALQQAVNLRESMVLIKMVRHKFANFRNYDHYEPKLQNS